jgi:hypothetical protein
MLKIKNITENIKMLNNTNNTNNTNMPNWDDIKLQRIALSPAAYKAKAQWIEEAKKDKARLMNILQITALDELALKAIEEPLIEVVDILFLIERLHKKFIVTQETPKVIAEGITSLTDILYTTKRKEYNQHVFETYGVDIAGMPVKLIQEMLGERI